MSVRERILAIRIAEAISKQPEIAEELRISAELVECRDPRRPILQTKKKPSASWGNAIKSGGKCWQMPGETCFPQRKSKAFWAKCTI